ncbi:MAG: MoxR family ATPase [Chitinophagaceae bacterium]|jgi:MoxR-like ATPase|nr:MoxR family ATPase [Chitinophagaceae bacterium]MBK8301843.1 MoxR family ATPase [Chitinophagaceae bacterium]MBK9661326.1 MoxR family ATPase [Chitinophagaceae bacterium]MBL0069540.1 MoxR family ATPase [Chitinophagaceae bacterium]MBP6233310.1 MoxR family ATPase [Chitinophagaceae bacterium]
MEEQIFQQRTDLTALNHAVLSIRNEIKKIIVGQDEMVKLIIAAMLADGHVLIEGVPGVAKTLTAKLVAKSVNAGFSRIQFTPDLMPSDVLGTPVFNPKEASFEFKKGPIFSNIILVDEINRAPAKTQSALLEIMEERQATVDGRTYPMASPFMVLATQNPVEQEGTYRLPEAQLDRFLFKIIVPYPTETEEMEILTQFNSMGNTRALDMISPALDAQQVASLRQQIKTQIIEEKLLAFIAKLIHQTRNHKSIYLGASPRASLSIMNASKAIAAMQGRDFVTPEDILTVVPPVLRHRIILSPDKEMEGITEDDVIKQIIQGMDVPR